MCTAISFKSESGDSYLFLTGFSNLESILEDLKSKWYVKSEYLNIDGLESLDLNSEKLRELKTLILNNINDLDY